MKSVFIFILFISIVSCEDYYEYLEIDRQSTEREIRQAFKKKALLLHPDKNQVLEFLELLFQQSVNYSDVLNLLLF